MTDKLKPVLDALDQCLTLISENYSMHHPVLNKGEKALADLKTIMETHVLVEAKEPPMSLKKAKEAHDALLGWQPIMKYKKLALWVFECCTLDACDIDAASAQEKMIELGIIESRPTDPNTNEWGADELYFFKDTPNDK